MNEVEKMYKLANVKAIDIVEYVLTYIPQVVKIADKYYPPFTAEKQIDLIKWLAKKDCMYKLTYERDFLWCSQLEWQSSFCYDNFPASLANLINNLWQDLTDAEKAEIKNILEM